MWKAVFARQALEDARKLSESGLRSKAEELLAVIAEDPMRSQPAYEKLVGSLAGLYSRRINIQHRLVYEVFADEHTVRVLRMWTHYE
ncbi:MAG TPA: Txe/YoeB family addiction module toxin [Casimicrobiaceae bacterium]|jgi:Txe/YoeB family toxin of toxin-antitoxin system